LRLDWKRGRALLQIWASSARGQLFALWLLLALSAAGTALLFWQFYSQTAARQVAEGQELAARGCRAIGDRYRFYTTGWTAKSPPVAAAALHDDLTSIVSTALARFPGVEGGIWSTNDGTLAYAFPTYEGSGPKLDLPAAEITTIQGINDEARATEMPIDRTKPARSQTLVLHACPLAGVMPELSAWTMTRVLTWTGPAYDRLRWGLALTAFTVVTSTLLLALVLIRWTRRVTRLQQIIDAPAAPDLPRLPLTGDIDLDRLVRAVNATGSRLQDARQQAGAAERLAAVGRLSAGLAHEIRNPLMAMRLKAENALASGEQARAKTSLQSVLVQITRLENLLRNLLATTHRKQLDRHTSDLRALLLNRAEHHSDLASREDVILRFDDHSASTMASYDEAELTRAVDNLIINAIEASPAGGTVTLSVQEMPCSAVLRIQDEGSGIDASVASRLFEPFVTNRAEGTGLGLAIVREIVHAHGGEVRYIALDNGSSFEIELPIGEQPCPRS
jgi:signal transduction histidine kinase